MKTPLLTRYGPWALVTGATSGIGRCFADHLAARGFRLVLVARGRDRLDHLAAELTTAYGNECRPIACDLSAPEAAERIFGQVDELDIGLVINNAGDAQIGGFLELDSARELELIALNVTTPYLLARLFGRRMCGRGRGGIVFVSSTAAYFAMPFHGGYSAAKSFIACLGESLHPELKAQKVDTLVVVPGPTRTGFQARNPGVAWSEVRGSWLSGEAVVLAALAGLGRERVVIPGLQNAVLVFLATFQPLRATMLRAAAGAFKKVLPSPAEKP